MSLLAAPTSTPSVALRQSADVISSFGPLLQLAVSFQQILSTATILLSIRAYVAFRVICTALLIAGRIAAFNALFLSKMLATQVIAMTTQASVALWDAPSSRRLRKKLEREFFILFLGPGNLLCLMLFWPGWILLAAMGWALWPNTS